MTTPCAGAPHQTTLDTATAASAQLQGCTEVAVDWSLLPHELIPSILQHVSLDHRFSACALVSKAWAAAARSVLATIVSTQRPSALALCRAWHRRRIRFAQEMTRLCLGLSSTSRGRKNAKLLPILPLPCPNLRDLDLQHVSVYLASLLSTQDAPHPVVGSALPLLATLSALTGLTKLRMHGVVLLGPSEQRLPGLAALTSLQHLHARGVQHASTAADALNSNHKQDSGSPLLPDGLLAQLQQLTYLHVDGRRLCPAVSAADLQDISRLVRLQHLALSLMEVRQGENDEGEEGVYPPSLPAGICALTQLTYLEITSFSGYTLPNLAPLATLQHLELSLCGSLQAAALTELTGVQHLHLESFRLPGADDAVAVLSWLQQGHVTSLFLNTEDHLPHLEGDAAAAYGGLTTSKLKSLTLWENLSESAWQHVFPAGQLLPTLTYLEISSKDGPASCEPWQRIAAACPSLQQLDLEVFGLPEGPQATDQMPKSELLPLTALTSLMMSPLPAEHLWQLAALTWLQKLDLESNSIKESHLSALVSLHELTHLAIGTDRYGSEYMFISEGDYPCLLSLYTKKPTSSSSASAVSVVSQLRQHLDDCDSEREAAWQHRGNPCVMEDQLQDLGLLKTHRRTTAGRRCKSSNSNFPWPSARHDTRSAEGY